MSMKNLISLPDWNSRTLKPSPPDAFLIGLIQPEENQLGFITLAEISDSEAVDAMLAKVKKKLLAKGAKEIAKIKEGSALVTHYEFKDPFGIAGPPQVFLWPN